ncbi:hypothetical protein IHE33_11315 [Mycetohabitans endofungorum]
MQSSTFMLLRGGRTFSLLSMSAVAIGTVIALGLVAVALAPGREEMQPFILALRLPGFAPQDTRPADGNVGTSACLHNTASGALPAVGAANAGSAHVDPRGPRALAGALSMQAGTFGSAAQWVTAARGQDGKNKLGRPAQPFVAPGAAQRDMTVRIGAPTPQLRPLSPIVPVSVDICVASRPDMDRSAVRAGSLRADITRYNTEHRHVPPARRAPPYVPPPHDAWPYAH